MHSLVILLWVVLAPILLFLVMWTSLALYFSNIPFEGVRIIEIDAIGDLPQNLRLRQIFNS